MRRRRKTDWMVLLRLVMAALALVGLGIIVGLLVPRPAASAVEEHAVVLDMPAPAAAPAPAETVEAQVEEAVEEPSVRYDLSDAERDLVERVVMAEAGGEDFDGQALVAQCILNTAEARSMRPDAVVLEAGQYATPYNMATDQVKEAVSAVFDDGYIVTGEPVRYFYAPRYCYSSWHENRLVFVLEHGGHRFFKEAGA